MNATELGVLLAGISSILGVIVYFTKNIKQSKCCGSECRQVVVDKEGRILDTGTPKKVSNLGSTII
tara:strand:- start:268 stop:465 length:198 start_codon:yes stop_codon:yes gene_type:complete